MKQQLALLRELQRIDLKLDEITSQKEAIQKRLSENKDVLDKLTQELDNRREELTEIEKLERDKQGDKKEVIETLKERKKRLLNVGSTKEYNAVEKEIEVLQKSSETLDDELISLNVAIESNKESIAQKTEMVDQLREGIAQEEANAADELTNLDNEIQAMETRTQEVRETVSKRVIYKYDFIRSRRPGTAIVAAEDGHCNGCFMALPPQLFIQVQRGENLETCPSCQRILYFWEDAIGEDGDGGDTKEAANG